MNYQFDCQMQHPLEWSEDYVVLLADEQVQLSGLSPAACRVGSRFDDLRARLGGLSAMETGSGRNCNLQNPAGFRIGKFNFHCLPPHFCGRLTTLQT